MAPKHDTPKRASELELLTAQEVAEITGVAVSTLHLYASRREAGIGPFTGPPHTRLGPRKRRWLRADVVAWIESCRVMDGSTGGGSH